MAIEGYLAMTGAEMRRCAPLPRGVGWMACHFTSTGVGDLPGCVPPGSLLILDDSRLPEQPDLDRICRELNQALRRSSCSGLLLDFQRRDNPMLKEITQALAQALSCPVAVSEGYGRYTHGPVFLSMVPPHIPLSQALKPWKGRELWLEAGRATEIITLKFSGAEIAPAQSPLPPCPMADPELCCHYGIEVKEDKAVFSLRRSPEDLQQHLKQAEALGVTRYVGIWQELKYLPI